ncbi:Bifunctional purine biosynthesis protein PurH [subsurface metagenome]
MGKDLACQLIEAPGVRLESARANIDIGGPCMIRAAAKNFLRVVPVIDADDYTSIIKELEQSGGCISLKTRFELAGKVFAHTAAYDRAIAGYLAEVSFEEWRGK